MVRAIMQTAWRDASTRSASRERLRLERFVQKCLRRPIPSGTALAARTGNKDAVKLTATFLKLFVTGTSTAPPIRHLTPHLTHGDPHSKHALRHSQRPSAGRFRSRKLREAQLSSWSTWSASCRSSCSTFSLSPMLYSTSFVSNTRYLAAMAFKFPVL